MTNVIVEQPLASPGSANKKSRQREWKGLFCQILLFIILFSLHSCSRGIQRQYSKTQYRKLQWKSHRGTLKFPTGKWNYFKSAKIFLISFFHCWMCSNKKKFRSTKNQGGFDQDKNKAKAISAKLLDLNLKN